MYKILIHKPEENPAEYWTSDLVVVSDSDGLFRVTKNRHGESMAGYNLAELIRGSFDQTLPAIATDPKIKEYGLIHNIPYSQAEKIFTQVKQIVREELIKTAQKGGYNNH